MSVMLQGKNRTILGNSVKKLRKKGILPGVIYGKKQASASIQANEKDFNRFYREFGKNHVFNFEDGAGKFYNCLIHGVDLDPVKDTVRHFDLLAVDLKEKVKTVVPVKLINQAPGIKEFGAILVNNLTEIEIEALPNQIPDNIEVDLSVLNDLHSSVHVRDLPKMPFNIISNQDDIIVSLSVPKQQSVESKTEQSIEPETEESNKTSEKTK